LDDARVSAFDVDFMFDTFVVGTMLYNYLLNNICKTIIYGYNVFVVSCISYIYCPFVYEIIVYN
jgi:hypothetical protein